jgi:hypothetical protein
MDPDLTLDEQRHVRAAVAFLRNRMGTAEALAEALRLKPVTIRHVREGRQISASIAFRVARLAGVKIDDLLEGRFPPPGTCPHCGRGPDGMAVFTQGSDGE